MKTVRRNIFETNSSSCHALTVMSHSYWDEFKAHNLFLINGVFEYEEHEDRYYDIRGKEDEYFITFADFFKQVKAKVASYEYKYSYYFTESTNKFYEQEADILKKNFSKKFFLKLLDNCYSDDYFIRFENPIEIKYSQGSSIYDGLTWSQLFSTLTDVMGYNGMAEFYGGPNWSDIKSCSEDISEVKLTYDGDLNLIQSTNDHVVIALNKDKKEIIIRNKDNEKVTIEREVEC